MKKELYVTLGFIIYIAVSCIDRFIVHIPDVIYIPAMLAALAFLFIGIFKLKKSKNAE